MSDYYGDEDDDRYHSSDYSDDEAAEDDDHLEQEQWRNNSTQWVTTEHGEGNAGQYVNRWASRSSSEKRRRKAMRDVAAAMDFPQDHPVSQTALGYMDFLYLNRKTQVRAAGGLIFFLLVVAVRGGGG